MRSVWPNDPESDTTISGGQKAFGRSGRSPWFSAAWTILWACLLFPAVSWADESPLSAEAVEFFESHVRPVLAEHCFKCHGADKQQAGLRLDAREFALQGGENGPAIQPGQAEASLLLTAIRYTGDTQMPPDGKLPEAKISAIEEWIRRGAPWPVGDSSPDALKQEKQRTHWAFQPVNVIDPPQVSDEAWCLTPVDRFVLARLETEKISHSPVADRRTLIRRVTYDLLGLPPTPEEVDAFINDTSENAYEKLIERLLESPHYGEQWARHWLDVARYSDTKGYVYGREERVWVHAPTYRDWVVQAFNKDLPYDRFLMLQIAADQVAPDDKASQAAMGFLTLGRRFLGVTHDIYDDRIDVITRGTLGLTASCARCHDHKYDPISTADYYALYGVFMNSHEELVPAGMTVQESASAAAFEKELAEKWRIQADLLSKKRTEAADRQRGRINDYLIAQTELGKYPQEGFDLILATTDLIPALVWKWEAYIAAEVHATSPIWEPWQRFARLKPEEFATESPRICLELQSPGQTQVNSFVAASFQAPPATMREVAQRYAMLLMEVNKAWAASLEAAKSLGAPEPTTLPQPDLEALRQVLYGPASPCMIPDESIVSTETLYDSESVNQLWGQHNEIDRTIINSPSALPFAVVLKDRTNIRPNRILKRGNPASKGDFVERHTLSIIAGEHPPAFSHGSGRLELAQSIVDPHNPLTARVWVNRIWQHHFGAGLVRTPSDFGIRAENPSHPELLDWLATQLIQNGWSTKHIHRLIVLSNTYQQQSTGPLDPAERRRAEQIDPENRTLWRMNVHRLTWEEYRDSLLTLTGQLDRHLGGRSSDLFAGSGTGNRRRTLYGTVDRQFLPSVMRMFDFANPDLHIPARSETTVPQQALFGLNHPLMAEKAQALAALSDTSELSSSISNDSEARVIRLFQLVYQRNPQPWEKESALQFVTAPTESSLEQIREQSRSWSYGYGEIDPSAGVLKSFQPLPYFSGSAWQGGTAWPDAALGWVQITSTGGHPGNDWQHASIRRWTAPHAGTYRISSTVRHEVDAGDGIRCWIISSRSGALGTMIVHHQTSDFHIPSVALEAGDTIDFVVDIHEVLNNDQHLWAPEIRELAETPVPFHDWMATRDFIGPQPRVLSPWDQLAQVLLLSNELTFVD